jgi:copper resistance protein D
VEYALYISRVVQFAAVMALFGGTAFRFYALGDTAASAGLLVAFDKWLRRLALAAAILALISALTLLLCQSAIMAGSPAATLDPTTVSAVLFETHFGRVWAGYLLLALILVFACLGTPRRRPTAILALSLLLLASLAWIGHAAMESGAMGIAHALNQTVHLVAAGLWLGGLLPLGWWLRRARTRRDDRGLIMTRDAIRHFSQMGYIAVAVIALTGVINSFLLVGGFSALIETRYGRLLGVKVLLFLAMVAIALVNRLYLAPRLSSNPAALGALCRTVGLEQGLGLCILAVVSILGTLPPALLSGH